MSQSHTGHGPTGPFDSELASAVAYYDRLVERTGQRDKARREVLDKYAGLTEPLQAHFAVEDQLLGVDPHHTSTRPESDTSLRPNPDRSSARDQPQTAWQRHLAKVSPEEFRRRLLSSRLVMEAEVSQWEIPAGTADSVLLAETARQKLGLNDWQLEQLAKGNTALLLDNGRYELLGKIGRGGMGTVYLARHRLMQRSVALKVVHTRRMGDPHAVARFRREVLASSRLQHEHIVHAYDVGSHGEVVFLVLEYVQGIDLASIIRHHGPMDPQQVAAIGMQAAAALSYAHSQGIVHRDIKPRNILLSTEGVTKVLDMGLARIDAPGGDDHTSLTKEGMLMGTVDYMAPEQARDTRSAIPASDIYSLGATLYYLLTGRPPFAGGNTIDKLSRLANEAPEALALLRPDCPGGLVELVMQMLEKEPSLRPSSAEEVVRGLQPFAAERVSGRPMVTRAVQVAAETRPDGSISSVDAEEFLFAPPSVLSRVRRKQRTVSQATWGMIAGAMLVVMLGGIIWATRRTSPSESTSPSDNSGSDPPALVLEVSGSPPRPVSFRADLGSHVAVGDYLRILQRPGEFVLGTDSGTRRRSHGAICWSPNELQIATACDDADVRIWGDRGGSSSAVYSEHTARVLNLTWSSDSQRIASVDLLGEVRIWDVARRETLARRRVPWPPEGHTLLQMGLAFSPDGEELAVSQHVTGSGQAGIIVWRWREDRILAANTIQGSHVLYSPTGRLLTVWGPSHYVEFPFFYVLNAEDCAVVLSSDQLGSDEWVLGFQSDDILLTLNAAGDRVSAWHTTTGEQVAEHSFEPTDKFWGAASNGRLLFFRSGEVVTLNLVLDGDQPEFRESVSVWRSQEPAGHACPSRSLARCVFDLNSTAVIRSLPDGHVLGTFALRSMRTPPIGELVSHRYVRLPAGAVDLQTGEMVSRFPEVGVVLPDGRVRSLSRKRVVEFPAVDRLHESSTIVSQLEGFETTYNHKFAADGESLYGLDGPTNDLIVWDVVSGEIRRRVEWAGVSLWQWRPIYPVDNHLLRLHFDSTTHEARLQLFVDDWETPVRETPLPPHALHSVLSTTLSPDGRYAAVCKFRDWGGQLCEPLPCLLCDFESDSSEPVELKLTLRCDIDFGFPDFTPSGRYLYVTNEVWDPQTRECLWVCPERSRMGSLESSMTQFCQALDDQRIIIWQNNQIQVWDWTQNRKLISFLFLPHDQWALVNFETGCWTGSIAAFQTLQLGLETASGRIEWFSPRRLETETGWVNDPTRAGLSSLAE